MYHGLPSNAVIVEERKNEGDDVERSDHIPPQSLRPAKFHAQHVSMSLAPTFESWVRAEEKGTCTRIADQLRDTSTSASARTMKGVKHLR